MDRFNQRQHFLSKTSDLHARKNQTSTLCGTGMEGWIGAAVEDVENGKYHIPQDLVSLGRCPGSRALSIKATYATLKLFPVTTRTNCTSPQAPLPRKLPPVNAANLQETRLTRRPTHDDAFYPAKEDPHRSRLPKTALIRSLSPGIGSRYW